MEVIEMFFKTPVPKLTKKPNFAAGTPLSTKMPSLKRMRDNFENSDYTNLIEELKSRRADKDEMLDFVLGLISNSPNAKEIILVILRNNRFGAKTALKSLKHKSSPNRLNKATKIRSASNHFQILNLNTRSIKKHLEELEALISCFESPSSVICLTESWLMVNDAPTLFKVTNYNTCLSKSRSGRGGGIMIQINDEVNLIEELNCTLNESLWAHLKFGELKSFNFS